MKKNSHPKDEHGPARPRIALAWNYLEWGGAQIYFIGIARQLRDRAHFAMLMPKGTSARFLELCDKEGITVEFLENSVSATLPPDLVGKVRRHFRKLLSEVEFVRQLLKGDYDILHVDLSPWQSVLALIVLASRLPVFYTVHNRLPAVSLLRTLSWKMKFRTASLFSGMRAFASNKDARAGLGRYVSSEYLADVAITFTNVNRGELDAIARSREDLLAYRERFGVAVGERVVTCLGQFIDRKGRLVLLDAARRISRRSADFRFFWVTDTRITASERALVASHVPSERFRILTMDADFSNRADMLGFLAASDIFVLPSYVEGLPIALLEAMYLGVPSISTDVNGIPEAIQDMRTGLLVPPGSAQDIEQAILRLDSDAELRGRIAEAGRKWVGECFVEDQVAEVVWAEYSKALPGKPTSASGGVDD